MALPKLNTPKYKMKLPSTGKVVNYRPFLVKEEKLLLIATETGDQDVTDPSTIATDFLMIHRHRVNYDDGKAGNNFYSRKNPGNQQKVIYDDA